MRFGSLGLGLSKSSSFNPALLFGASTAGAFYDPSDIATMYQDSAGTTPAAVDSPVGRINDKSGRGNHATQATAAARPMLRRDSGGRLYLEFDGVDDFLSASFAIAQPWDRISAIRQISWTDFDRILGSPTGLGGRLLQTGVSPSVGIHSGAFIGMSPNLAVGTNGVITERHNGANSRVALNNNAYVTGNAGTTAVDGIALGAGGGSNFANVRIYGALMIARSLTDGETAQVRRYFAGRANVSF